ncbi:MAG: hypothetical protein ACI38Q_04495 [Candidatus Bruticola sp.]
MDAMRGLDPSSSMFQTQATRNLSHIGFGSVRSQKEVTQKQDETAQHEVRDNVQLSLTGQMDETPEADEMTKNAAMSGNLSEVLEDSYDDDEEINERKFRDDEEQYGTLGELSARNLGNDIKAEDIQRLNRMDDDAMAAREILSDVPARSLEPAKNYVSNMIHGNRPTETLAALTPVEGVNQIEFTPAQNVGILDIHDSQNKPITDESGEEISAQAKQSAAEEFMNNAISGLPEDRQAMVSQMKDAVENWAGANGLDPKAAFAEKLRDLAAGWDDESLQAVAQIYIDADREMATSAAG